MSELWQNLPKRITLRGQRCRVIPKPKHNAVTIFAFELGKYETFSLRDFLALIAKDRK